jgi:hexosaminidase
LSVDRANVLRCLVMLAASLAPVGCRSPNPLPGNKSEPAAIASAPLALIPAPYLLERAPGFFGLDDGAAFRMNTSDTQALAVAAWFQELAQRTRGVHLNLHADAETNIEGDGGIDFVLDPQLMLTDDAGDEGYRLTVATHRITLTARSAHGLFNGATTLWQLLTADDAATGPVRIPCLRIDDHPRFVWRGVLLDPARHFQSPEFVKRFIDSMALHKLNVLQLHLTDDQGWRIEIKKYPKLTQVGAWRRDTDADGRPSRYGGFYTQEQIRDIVRYAQARFVTIVPEIEMPGHAQAAIAAYPQFGVTGKNPGVSHVWGVHGYLFNVEDSTFTFIQDVLSEVMELFPSPYIHVGGDEAAKVQWQASRRVQRRMHALGLKDETALQHWFIERVAALVNAHGRHLIGWEEIGEGGLPAQAAVMEWHGMQAAIDAAKQGHDAVLATAPDLYLDYVQSDLPEEPIGRPDVVSLQRVYAFDPVAKDLDAAQTRHILGAEASLWGEYLDDDASVEYAAYPRLAAFAEMQWSPADKQDWTGFVARLPVQLARYRQLGIRYAQTAFAVRIDAEPAAASAPHADGKSVQIKLSNQASYGTIRYTLDGSTPNSASPIYTAPITTASSGEIRVAAFVEDRALADPRSRALDPAALARLSSAGGLRPCRTEGVSLLRLPVATGSDHVGLLDQFDPCWIYPHASLDRPTRIAASIGNTPYVYFQLAGDLQRIVERKPIAHAQGELQVHLDRCDGELLATIALTPARARRGTTTIDSVLPARAGSHDLCLQFATAKHDPLWAIDWIEIEVRR